MAEETWAGDEWEEPDHPEPVVRRRGRRVAAQRASRARGIPRDMAGAARAQVTAQATGRSPSAESGWRDELRNGERSKAIASLATRKPTHNAGSGFGLA